MFNALNSQAAKLTIRPYLKIDLAGNMDSRRRLCWIRPRRPVPQFISLTVQPRCDAAASSTSEPSVYTSTIGSSVMSSSLQLSQWNLSQCHITLLNVIACAVAISATWLFCSAIPTLLAFKRAAVSLEKLMDVTREELPDTMAAIRLSGMEISDLTMELSDLGQEITQGVKSSTRAVRVAEERLRRLTNMAPSGGSQPEN
ncbi:Transmembrane protein [Quillaja saponaria]|uniref:Transmembrane protein n=1 Tax=Quillaja saponaria TaxID=32244 RepID=A0AAD7KTD2_QUISA|nr:Transmembrane protein [Quillaja saponaria]